MANVSFVGTIKSFDVVESDEIGKQLYVKIKENDLFIDISPEILEGTQLILEKGKAYLFTGDIHCYNPSFAVHEIIDKPLNAISEKLTDPPHNNGYILVISGRIIEVRCQTTRKGKTAVYAKIEGVDIPEIFFFPDQAKRCLSAYENKETITIVGELQIQKPDFTAESVEQYHELFPASEEDIGQQRVPLSSEDWNQMAKRMIKDLQMAELELRKIKHAFEEGIKEHEWVVGHSRGFEAEEAFSMVLREHRGLKSKELKEILARIAPEFVKDLYKVRSCVRDLKYVGCEKYAHDSCDCAPHKFFEIGKNYKSIDFNGGTYSIEEYEDGKKRIGSAFFEVVRDYTFEV